MLNMKTLLLQKWTAWHVINWSCLILQDDSPFTHHAKTLSIDGTMRSIDNKRRIVVWFMGPYCFSSDSLSIGSMNSVWFWDSRNWTSYLDVLTNVPCHVWNTNECTLLNRYFGSVRNSSYTFFLHGCLSRALLVLLMIIRPVQSTAF